jgi:hypothetical protein
MGIKLTNNAFGTLAAGINSSATSITLTSGQGTRFPTLGAGDYFYATLIDTSNNLEIVKCTARSTDVLTVVRAQESTTARAYNTGDRIEIRITAATFTEASAIEDGEVTAVKLGSDAPLGVSDKANSSTGYFALPAGTTAQRPASPVVGMIRYNTTLGQYEIYSNNGWVIINYSDPIRSYAVEYLVVAGGGGGGSDNSGGGGGGGVLSGIEFVHTGTLHSVTVGAGGAGAPGGNIDSQTNGEASQLFAYLHRLTAVGGGFGANGEPSARPAGSGGSGGGGEGENSSREAGGAGTSGQGFAGGNALASSQYGGGGGGAGGVGNNSVAGLAGNGGQGLLSAINGTARYYGSGGGGSGIGDGGTGGSFSGFGIGNGNTGVGTGTNGETNSGGGGGGGSATANAGGNGGSGIVIVRYAGSQRATGGTITSSGGYTIHTFTSSGTFTA